MEVIRINQNGIAANGINEKVPPDAMERVRL